MAIRKPVLSVQEARRLSAARSEAPETSRTIDSPRITVAQILEHETFREQSAAIVPTSIAAPLAAQATSIDATLIPKAASAPQRPSLPIVCMGRIQVFVSAAYPERGVSASFDLLSAKYPPAKALQMILRRAMDEYEDRLADGSFASLPETYAAVGPAVVQTSRIMPQELADVARLHFDPLGFESSRAFGLKLATAALATFFGCEHRRR